MKNKIKQFMPKRHHITENKTLRIFGTLLHNSNLWHLNRHSVARAFSVGLFCAWVPVPFQMVIAAGGAIIFHANLPLSVALVWLTNPATMPPLFFFAYKIGTLVLSKPTGKFSFELSWDWLLSMVSNTWQPFLLGCLICGIFSALIGNISIRLIWRYFTIQSWQHRREKRQKRKNKS